MSQTTYDHVIPIQQKNNSCIIPILHSKNNKNQIKLSHIFEVRAQAMHTRLVHIEGFIVDYYML